MPLQITGQDNERQAGNSGTETSTSTLQSAPTSTGSEKEDNKDAGSSDKGRLDTSQLVGTIVGVLGLIVAVVTLWVTWKMGKLKNPFLSVQHHTGHDAAQGHKGVH
jgi:cobalamin biosynthesis Mg chelatase CobN